MLRFVKWALSVALFANLSFGVTICTETASGATAGDAAMGQMFGGCINSIPTSNPLLFVASDGEVSFRPFNLQIDVSDAIMLTTGWVAQANNAWTQLPGTFIWYLPSVIPGCGTENEPVCEPIGAWFAPGFLWSAATPPSLEILG